MKIAIIIMGVLVTYLVFATLFNTTGMVGHLGEFVGGVNLTLFGEYAYVNGLFVLLPLFVLYTSKTKYKEVSFYVGWFLVNVSALFLSVIILETTQIGMVGEELKYTFKPLVGDIGMWLITLMFMAVSVMMLKPKDYTAKPLLFGAYVLVVSFIFSVSRYVKEGVRAIFDVSYNNVLVPSVLLLKKDTAHGKLPKQEKVLHEEKVIEEIQEVEEAVLEEKDTEKEIVGSEGSNLGEVKKDTKQKVEMVGELSENSKLMQEIERGKLEAPKNFKLPKMDFLKKPPKASVKLSDIEIDRKVEELIAKLREFKIEGEVVRTYTGPIVTTFEFKPEANVKVSKILSLQDDLAMALSAETIRIQAPIPGRNVVGIEIPNETFDTIYLREILEDESFREAKSPLTVALGKDIVGNPFITDLKKLPHLLIAGTTGSGKSVGINAMILSLLYRNDPDKLKLMLIDPKMLEFTMYNDIPHLLTPVITNPQKAIAALTNMVSEMERRYTLMAESRTKNIDNYNEKAKKEKFEPFPFIVVVIDELADLMMNGGKEVEISIARLAQKSRACGIHLIVATQRPSVDVVTGLIKANLPSRLSYRVGQRIDSKVILDTMGAESLLGNGDGLFTPPGSTGLVRIHAPWNSEDEIDKIVNYIKKQREPEYDEGYLIPGYVEKSNAKSEDIQTDELYEEAKQVIMEDRKTSISYLQRKLSIGYNRAANIIEQLESTGVLSAPNAKGVRDIL